MVQLGDLFDVEYGNKFDLNKMVPDASGVAFIGRRGGGQGVAGHVAIVEGKPPYPAGKLTVALGGSLLATFVQQEPFYTAQNVAVLTPKIDMSLRERLFYSMCIEANRFRYTAFGREANRTLRTLDLPDAAPTWTQTMGFPDLSALERAASEPVPLRDPATWAWHSLGELFDIKRGKYIPKSEQKVGTTPTVTSSSSNNGISKFLDIEAKFPAGSITVARNGSIGEAFFQPQAFFASDDVHVFVPKVSLDPYAALFASTIIRQEKFRYGYGRKWSLDRMKDTLIKLPSDQAGSPDWIYMRRYIEGLRYSGSVAHTGN